MGPAQPMYVFEGAPRSKFGRIASMSAHAAMLTAVYSDAYISTNHDIIRVFKAQSRVGSRLAGSGLPGSTTAALSFSPSTINSFAEGAVIHRIDGKSNACDPSRLVRVENPYGLVYNRARDRQEWLHADELNNRKKWVLSVKQTKWKLGSPAQYAHGRGKPSIVTVRYGMRRAWLVESFSSANSSMFKSSYRLAIHLAHSSPSPTIIELNGCSVHTPPSESKDD